MGSNVQTLPTSRPRSNDRISNVHTRFVLYRLCSSRAKELQDLSLHRWRLSVPSSRSHGRAEARDPVGDGEKADELANASWVARVCSTRKFSKERAGHSDTNAKFVQGQEQILPVVSDVRDQRGTAPAHTAELSAIANGAQSSALQKPATLAHQSDRWR